MSGFRHDLDALDSRDRDLGALMADPRTKLVRLSPVDDLERGVHSPVRHASVAWNDARQSGVFFCDGLVPADGSDRYRLWLVPPAGAATGIELARPEPGRTVYPLSPEIRAPAPGVFVLTDGPGALDLKGAGGNWLEERPSETGRGERPSERAGGLFRRRAAVAKTGGSQISSTRRPGDSL